MAREEGLPVEVLDDRGHLARPLPGIWGWRWPKYRERIVALLELVRGGSPPWRAARAVGIPKEYWASWRRKAQRGKPSDQKYVLLMAAVDEAQEWAQCQAHLNVHRARPDRWLEIAPSRHGGDGPDEPGYVDPTRHEISGPGGGPVQSQSAGANLDALSVEELEVLRALVEKAGS